MKGVRVMCNTTKESCQQKAAMMQTETNYFFFFFFLKWVFSAFQLHSLLKHICVVSSNYRTLLGHNPVCSGNQSCISDFKKQQRGGHPSDPDFAKRMDAILVIEGKGGCQRWVKLKVNCILIEEKQV